MSFTFEQISDDIRSTPLEDILHELYNDLIRKRDDELLKAIKLAGYDVKPHELLYFTKTRCTIEKYPNKLNILKVDGKTVAEWWDTLRYEINENKATCIVGERPKAY